MKNKEAGRHPLRLLVQAGYVVVALIGLKYGFEIGLQMAGPLIGAVMAFNSAIFGVLLYSVVAAWVERRIGPRDEPPGR